MRALISFALALAVAACSPTKVSQSDQVMNDIEAKIRLPKGAYPLQKYARAYSLPSNGKVFAIYFRPFPDPISTSCDEAQRHKDNEGQVALTCSPPVGMKEDERRWFRNQNALPNANDGGCDFIDVEFDVKARSVEHAECHGQA
jgi:hypothetical protein